MKIKIENTHLTTSNGNPTYAKNNNKKKNKNKNDIVLNKIYNSH
jgi:hypothetical protein